MTSTIGVTLISLMTRRRRMAPLADPRLPRRGSLPFSYPPPPRIPSPAARRSDATEWPRIRRRTPPAAGPALFTSELNLL